MIRKNHKVKNLKEKNKLRINKQHVNLNKNHNLNKKIYQKRIKKLIFLKFLSMR